jgi:menaquinone-9 beta-reductase
MRTSADVLVIGGGPAGAAAAARLAAAGREVILCERHARPRAQVCGEFISASTAAELAALDLHPTALGAVPIRRMQVVCQSMEVGAALPFVAYGLSRERLDRALLAKAARCGGQVRFVGVRSLERGPSGWGAALTDGTAIESPAVLLATGKHELRGYRRPRARSGPLIGFKMHWLLSAAQRAALAERIELFWFDGGYAGLQPVEQDLANLCLVVSAETWRDAGESWPGLLARLRALIPALDARLLDARSLGSRPATIAGMPYGYVCPGEACAKSLYRLGDQFAVIPSFSGEGLAIALRTARLAASAVLAGEPAEGFARAARKQLRPPIRYACGIGALAGHRAALRLALPLGRLPGVLPALARSTRLRPRSVPSTSLRGLRSQHRAPEGSVGTRPPGQNRDDRIDRLVDRGAGSPGAAAVYELVTDRASGPRRWSRS